MTSLIPISLAALWGIVALFTPAASDYARTRRRITWVMAISAAAAGLAWAVVSSGAHACARGPLEDASCSGTARLLGVVPFVVSLIGVVAIGLSDRLSHSVGTLRRIVLLLANAIIFFATDEPLVLAASWAFAPIVVWFELRTRNTGRGAERLFMIYHAASIALFVVAQLAPVATGGAWIVTAAMIAIGIRESVIPGHGWFVRFVEAAPMGLVVAFVAPQLGVHAQIMLLERMPSPEIAQVVAGFGAVTAVLAAALGTVQVQPRRALAYLLMSQTGLVSFGISALSDVAYSGGLIHWQVLAISMSGFAMTVSALQARRGNLSLEGFTGCFSRTPRMAGGFLTMGLGSVGLPLTLGFVAEDLLVQGSISDRPGLAFALIVATALNGVNVLRFFFHAFSGRRQHTGEADLTNREAWALSCVLAVLLLGGLFPSGLVSATRRSPTERGAPQSDQTARADEHMPGLAFDAHGHSPAEPSLPPVITSSIDTASRGDSLQ